MSTIIRLDLMLREAVATPYRDLVTRPTGAAVRAHHRAEAGLEPVLEANGAVGANDGFDEKPLESAGRRLGDDEKAHAKDDAGQAHHHGPLFRRQEAERDAEVLGHPGRLFLLGECVEGQLLDTDAVAVAEAPLAILAWPVAVASSPFASLIKPVAVAAAPLARLLSPVLVASSPFAVLRAPVAVASTPLAMLCWPVAVATPPFARLPWPVAVA